MDLSNTERVALVYDELLTKLGDQLIYNFNEGKNPKINNLPILKVQINTEFSRTENNLIDENNFSNYDSLKSGEQQSCAKLDAESENMMVYSDVESLSNVLSRNDNDSHSQQNNEEIPNQEVFKVNKDNEERIEVNNVVDINRKIDKNSTPEISMSNQSVQIQRLNTVLGLNPSKAASSALAWMNSAFTSSSKIDPYGDIADQSETVEIGPLILNGNSDCKVDVETAVRVRDNCGDCVDHKSSSNIEVVERYDGYADNDNNNDNDSNNGNNSNVGNNCGSDFTACIEEDIDKKINTNKDMNTNNCMKNKNKKRNNNDESNDDENNTDINTRNENKKFGSTDNHFKKEKDKLVKRTTRLISSRSGTSNSSKIVTSETAIDNDALNIGIDAFKSAPVRNKIGTYFGHNMSKLDVFRYLPATANPLTLIIEAKTPQQRKSGKGIFLQLGYRNCVPLSKCYHTSVGCFRLNCC